MRVARAAATAAGALVLALIPAAASVAAQAFPATAEPAAKRLSVVRDPRITENSGLAVSPSHRDLVWTLNDSGSAPIIFGVSPRTGRTRAVVRMSGVDARDTEAIAAGRAAGRSWIWVGDIGDNTAARTSVVLRLLREPSTVGSQTVPVTSLRVRYPHGPADAETLVWLPDGRLLVVTKALLTARVYQVPAAAVRQALAGHDVSEPVEAKQISTIAQTLATDGDALPDGRVVVRGYDSATVYGWRGRHLVAESMVDLPSQRQGEGITVERGGRTALVSSEGERQPLYRVALPAAPSPSPSTTSSPSGTAAGGVAGQPHDTQSEAGAPSDSGGVGLGAPATLVGPMAAVLVLAGGFLGVRAARRRGRRTP